MKLLSRALGSLAILLAAAAVAVPALSALILIQHGEPALTDLSTVLGGAIAGAGVICATAGFFIGYGPRSTALPVVGGLTSICVVIGMAVGAVLV